MRDRKTAIENERKRASERERGGGGFQLVAITE